MRLETFAKAITGFMSSLRMLRVHDFLLYGSDVDRENGKLGEALVSGLASCIKLP